jgi:F0F1-type ATP synthase gamma subunit
MIAMEEATERAGRALAECRVLFNRLRREVITTDLLGVLFAAQVTKGEEGM